MSDAQVRNKPAVEMKLEVVIIPVSDVDRAKRFYGDPGWRLDIGYASGHVEAGNSGFTGELVDALRRAAADVCSRFNWEADFSGNLACDRAMPAEIENSNHDISKWVTRASRRFNPNTHDGGQEHEDTHGADIA